MKEVDGNSGVEAVSRKFPSNSLSFDRVSHIAEKRAWGIMGARSGMKEEGVGFLWILFFFSRKWHFLRNLLRLMQIHERHRDKMLDA